MTSQQSIDEMLTALRQTQQTFLELLGKVDETTLYSHSIEDSWTLAETLVHMAEARQFFAGETRRVVAAPGSKVGRTMEDEGRLSNISEHGSDPLEIIRQKLVTSHQSLLDLLSGMSDDDLQLECEHIKFGRQTLGELVQRFIVGHDQAHAEQAQMLLPSI